MKKIFLFFLIFIIFITETGCYKEKMVGEYLLTEGMKSSIPYNGQEKIFYKDTSSHSIKLIAGELQDKIIKSFNDHTLSDYILYEEYYLKISNEIYTWWIGISSYGIWNHPVNISFSFIYNEGDYRFMSDFEVFQQSNAAYMLDSVLINGTWLTNIYYDSLKYYESKPFPSELTRFPIMSYYSKSLGVVKIDFSDGSTWELEEIIWN